MRKPDSAMAPGRASGWHSLHSALSGGVPYANEIAILLDSGGFTFPSAPDFADHHTDLMCYGIVHSAWRARMLPEFLQLLQIWRNDDGRLREAARRPEFQQALLALLREHRPAGLPALMDCLQQQPFWRTAQVGDATSAQEVRWRFDFLWREYCGRRAA